MRAAVPTAHFAMPVRDHREQREHEPVGREREEQARLAHAAQVRDREREDACEAEPHAVRVQRRRGRRDRDDSGGDRDGDGEDVVGRAAPRPRRGSAACRGCPSRRRTRRRSSRTRARSACTRRRRSQQHAAIANEIGQDEVRSRAEAREDEHDQRGLRRVRDRRERVGCEDRQREELREERVLHLAARHRPADEDPLHALRPARRRRYSRRSRKPLHFQTFLRPLGVRLSVRVRPVVLSLGAVALVSLARLRARADRAGPQPRRPLPLRGAAGRRALGTALRGARLDREHARRSTGSSCRRRTRSSSATRRTGSRSPSIS